MKLFGTTWAWRTALAVAGMFTGFAAHAQTVTVVDEITAPAYDERYEEPPVVVRHREDPYAAVPMRRPPAEALLPPRAVFGALRARGYEPLGPALRRGWIYSIAVLDPNGDDGRIMVDARTGRVMRFVPAYAVSPRFNDELAVRYGRFGQPRIDELRRAPRPPMAVPHGAEPRMVNRTPSAVPLPRPRRVASKPAVAKAADKPVVDRAAPESAAAGNAAATRPAETTAQTSAAAESKTVGVAQAAKPAEAKAAGAEKPAEVELKPTQDMPPVQPLD